MFNSNTKQQFRAGNEEYCIQVKLPGELASQNVITQAGIEPRCKVNTPTLVKSARRS